MTVKTHPGNRSRIEAAFLKFHARNPHIYRELVRITRELREQGWERPNIATVYEIARSRLMVGRIDGPRPKLNNSYRSYFARLIMAREPDLKGVFQTRRLSVPGHFVP